MNKKTLRNTIVLSLVAVVLIITTVLTTLAYLASSAAVTNTFSVGNVSLTMFETPVDEDGKKVENAQKTSSANHYTLKPGVTYDKDPSIFVAANSTDSYLFVVIRNDIRPIEAEGVTIKDQMLAKGWKKYKDLTATTTAYVYAPDRTIADSESYPADDTNYSKVVASSSEEQKIDVFDTFTIKTDANVSTYGAAQVTVRAYAIQDDGFGTPGTKAATNAAWVGLVGTFSDLVDPDIQGSSTVGE